MARNDEGLLNPYAAPDAPLEGAPTSTLPGMAEKEAIRRQYLTHEASVKSIGSLYILGGASYLLATVVIGISSLNGAPGSWLIAVMMGASGSISLALGVGLTSLRSWARWIATALTAISFISILIGLGVAGFQLAMIGMVGPAGSPIVGVLVAYGLFLLIVGYILYLLVSPKGSMVFSHEYREVMEATPHIKYKTSCILKGFLIFLVVVVLLAVLGGVLSAILGKR